jgi:hypothetical protein
MARLRSRRGSPRKYGERQFTKEVIQAAQKKGWKIVHFLPGMMINRRWITPYQGAGKGFPDLILLRGTKTMVVELKMPGKEPTKDQYDWLFAFAAAGNTVALWSPDDWDKIERMLA